MLTPPSPPQNTQYADAHGEGCPANWKPGDTGVNPSKPQAFFKAWASEHAEL